MVGYFSLAVIITCLCHEGNIVSAYSRSSSRCNEKKDIRILTSDGMRRRSFLSGSLLSISTALLGPDIANAEDPLFRKNPLTNKVLEQFRILEQAEADNVQYSGELAPGTGKIQDNYAELLIPILLMQDDLVVVNDLLHQEGEPNLVEAQKILSQKRFEKIPFKKTFNMFADNIYYSDPDRANVYLAGGATPKNEQSIAYLIRNEILTQLEALQVEVTYLLKEKSSGSAIETDDLFLYSKSIVTAFEQYMDLIPPTELKRAKELKQAKQ